MTLVLAVAALTVAGLMVGVELCVAVITTPLLDRLPGNNGLLGRSDGARVLGRVMPFWYSSSIVLSVALGVAGWDQRGAGLLIAAAALFVLSIVMSIALLVPINNQAKTWTPAHAPSDWRERLHRWDRFHYVRLAVIAAAFVLLATGAILSQS
ncbi:MAG TPA: DUF1772 domain-containing protein [Streptomyces sp.]|jgi:uncharacterized membrane protein|nr:DUF1772 domain-containing protein [Streptomyces sp.]